MDWKYKHFHQERVFQAPRDVVLAAAQAYMTDTGWKIIDTADGFTAEGFSFFHAAIADFHLQSSAAGTAVQLDLKVERAGAGGFMLFDVGGYYSIQMRKWLDGIQPPP